MNKTSQTVSMTEEQYEDLIEKIEKRILSEEDWKFLDSIVKAYGYILQLLQYKKVGIQKLKNMIFGPKTEKKSPKNLNPVTRVQKRVARIQSKILKSLKIKSRIQAI